MNFGNNHLVGVYENIKLKKEMEFRQGTKDWRVGKHLE